MPYSAKHKAKSRENIIEAARILFNRHGFGGVTIDDVMAEVGLTRGGFYSHFASKEALYDEAVTSFLMGRGAQWRADAGVGAAAAGPEMAMNMIAGYLSPEHLADLDGQCPMIALPSDVARANPQVQAAYQRLLEAMVGVFETSLMGEGDTARPKALTLAALCVGGMVLARTLPDSELAEELRVATQATAHGLAAQAKAN